MYSELSRRRVGWWTGILVVSSIQIKKLSRIRTSLARDSSYEEHTEFSQISHLGEAIILPMNKGETEIHMQRFDRCLGTCGLLPHIDSAPESFSKDPGERRVLPPNSSQNATFIKCKNKMDC